METLLPEGFNTSNLDEVEARIAVLLRTLKGDGLDAFIRKISPHLPPPEHVQSLIALQERARHTRIRACISWPPRHAKTETCMHALAWWLKNSPADTCAYITYSDNKARGKSRIIRDRAIHAGVKLNTSSANLGEWRTQQDGGLVAVGVGGGITGIGITGLMIVDDPFKNAQEANSRHKRDVIWEWFTETISSRLEGASVIVVQTRWHEDDLIGRLMQEREGWDYYNFPAVAEEDDPIGREVGEALWPDVWPALPCGSTTCGHAGHLSETKAEIGEYGFSALYQGHPRPKGNTLFGNPHYYDPAKLNLQGCRVVIGVDPAASESTSADHSAAVALAIKGRGPTAEGYVLEVYRKQVSIPQLVADMKAMQARYWGALLAIEAVSGFKAVPQTLRAIDPKLRILEIRPTTDKFTRAQPVSAAWNADPPRLFLPAEQRPWLKDFLHETSVFTGVGDAHDDQVDALAHAWNSVAMLPEIPVRGSHASPGRWR